MADGKAQNTKSLFRTACEVTANIQATSEKIWSILTMAEDIPRWNSTIISLEGDIRLGETIYLKSTVAPERTFNLKVTTLQTPSKMVWEDGMALMFKGVRTYTLMPQRNGTTDFHMIEVISGLMLPIIGGSLPDFRPTFEQFAADLKQIAENS